MVPWGRLIIAIGYKYKAQKVLKSIDTEYVGRKKSGITYLYK